jgi:hypothetical protein
MEKHLKYSVFGPSDNEQEDVPYSRSFYLFEKPVFLSASM